MAESEKMKRMLTGDLVTAYDGLCEVEDLIVDLSTNRTATAYLLDGLRTEYKKVFELLAELKPYDIGTITQAILYLHDLESEKNSDD
jgi:hypothetical protein